MYKIQSGFFPILFLSFLLLLNAGCDGEDEPIPAFLKIEPFELLPTDPLVHGSLSQKITNARIFLTDPDDGSTHALGTLTLPVTVPVLVTGIQEITVDPMIRANGNSLFLQIYPFYERYTEVLELNPNVETILQPTTRYVSGARFEWVEGFEGNGHLFQDDRDGNPLTSLEISDEDVFEGNHSGRVRLDKDNISFAVATNEAYTIDFQEAGRVFMELNYKTDVQVQFGALAVDGQGNEFPFIQFAVFEKDEWNKIYFDFTEVISTAGEDRFIFVIQAGIPISEGVPTLDEAYIYFDNIKLIRF